MKPMNENSSIIYNNVNNITYQGTQAQGGTFIYNNVANIQKEAVELRNRYSSESSGFGVGVSAGIGSNGQIKSNGISGNISANRSNRNTVETIHANGSFTNVNEVHNNTGTMTLSGFNQEGGKVTGNIGKVEVISRQNTSTTTGSSKGVNLGISANGVPSSVTINASRTNGNRAFVDNQSTFVVGEGSNLHVGTVENTGAIIGKEGNSTFKIDTYAGKDIQNYDTMTTTGGSIGVSLGGNPKITNVGFNQDSRDKQGITRNTVVGDVEITKAEGSPINRDLGKANEVTKDTHSRTNINIEPQVIEYISNPAKFKEDLEVAILEGKATGETVLKSIENIVNGGKEDIGDPERRAINEIKEAVIRVKTAPQMESIAKAKDLNSPDILEKLDIAAIEKYDPYDPNLPIKVRQRVEKTLKDGKIPGVFYDEITNKIFVYKGMEDDLKIRAGIAREWKISEDLKNEKGKPNEEGRLKATVAGELAYDDMMKRGREGKTESISTDRFADAVMDVNSEVTSDKEIVKLEAFQKAWIDKNKKALNGKTGEENVKSAFFKQTGKEYTIDWGKYKNGTRANDLYVMKMNYYYFQAERFVTIEEFNRDRRNYRRVPDNEAVYHNIINWKIYIGDNKNIKYVNNDNGKEVVIDSNGKLVTDTLNRGTANRYTYLGDEDPHKKKHSIDVKNWVVWGTGIDDKSNVYQRIRILALGGIVSVNYDSIKLWAKSKGITSIGELELAQYAIDKKRYEIMDQYNNLLKFNPEQIAPRIMDLR